MAPYAHPPSINIRSTYSWNVLEWGGETVPIVAEVVASTGGARSSTGVMIVLNVNGQRRIVKNNLRILERYL